MTSKPNLGIDPNLDLVLEREVAVPPHLVWKAWTDPEHLKQWFAPKPYETPEAEIDLRPGGIFRVVMRSPEGEDMDQGAGCYPRSRRERAAHVDRSARSRFPSD